jgi:hypothetical protein
MPVREIEHVMKIHQAYRPSYTRRHARQLQLPSPSRQRVMQLYQQAQTRRIERGDLNEIESHTVFPTHLHGGTQHRDRTTGEHTAAAVQRHFISIAMYEDS